MQNLMLIVAAYLVGSISSAVIISRALGLPDPRAIGSGNPGATNVLRSGSKFAAIVTLLGDFAKGLVPVLVGKYLGAPPLVLAIIAVAAFLGHLFPVFFGFKGGKGVATAFGVIVGLSAWAALVCFAAWLACAVLTRYSSLSALVAAVIAPGAAYALGNPIEICAGLVVIAGFVLWRHRANIDRLRHGTESKIGEKSQGAAPARASGETS